MADIDVDQRLRDIQKEYLDFLDDDVSIMFNCLLICTTTISRIFWCNFYFVLVNLKGL